LGNEWLMIVCRPLKYAGIAVLEHSVVEIQAIFSDHLLMSAEQYQESTAVARPKPEQ
jgi:hypothetical protein